MQLTSLLTLAAAASAAALPSRRAAEADAKSMMADAPEWTIQSLKRNCKGDDSRCVFEFYVDTHAKDVEPTWCKFAIDAEEGGAASQTDGPAQECGNFTVTSGWSGQFGPDQGFTVLSIVDYAKRLIIWGGYTDKQIQSGKPVKPDQSYAPVSIPE